MELRQQLHRNRHTKVRELSSIVGDGSFDRIHASCRSTKSMPHNRHMLVQQRLLRRIRHMQEQELQHNHHKLVQELLRNHHKLVLELLRNRRMQVQELHSMARLREHSRTRQQAHSTDEQHGEHELEQTNLCDNVGDSQLRPSVHSLLARH